MTATATDWTPAIADLPAVYAARAQRALAAMAQAGVDRAVFVSCGRHLFTDMDPVVWLTGFKPMRSAAATIDGAGSITLYVAGEWEAERARLVGSPVEIVVAQEPFTVAGVVSGDHLAHQLVATGRIGQCHVDVGVGVVPDRHHLVHVGIPVPERQVHLAAGRRLVAAAAAAASGRKQSAGDQSAGESPLTPHSPVSAQSH